MCYYLNLQDEATPLGEQPGPPAPKTAKQLTAKRNQERVKSILLLAIRDEYLLKQRVLNEDLQQIDQDDLEELDIRYHKLSATTVTGNGTLLRNANQEGTKGKDLMVIMAGGIQQQMNHHHKHCSSSSFDNEVQNCSKQCLESFKTLQKNYDSEREKHSRARLEIYGYELALEFLESRIIGHEKNELAWGEKYKFQNYELKCREIKIDNLKMELEKVIKERDELKVKIEEWEESFKGLNKLLNSQMSAKDKNGLGYGTQLDEMSNKSETDSEVSMSVFEVRSSDEELTPANDRFSKAEGYHVVPPPIKGNFLTLRADISFAGLDEYAIRKKIIESKTTELNTDTSKSKTSETVGSEGVVGLTRWIEKMEPVFNISGYAIENQVNFATCTLLGAALTWWNGQIRTL
ncbi:hypothetical protein Tco_1278838, partial [Tanacetum coccineum]